MKKEFWLVLSRACLITIIVIILGNAEWFIHAIKYYKEYPSDFVITMSYLSLILIIISAISFIIYKIHK